MAGGGKAEELACWWPVAGLGLAGVLSVVLEVFFQVINGAWLGSQLTKLLKPKQLTDDSSLTEYPTLQSFSVSWHAVQCKEAEGGGLPAEH